MLTDFTYSYSQGTTDRELVQTMTDLGTRLPVQGVHSTTYSYNAVGRLAAATTQIAGSTTNWWQYAYDGNGNRTEKTHNDQVTSNVYNAAGELTTATTGSQTTTYSYDRNGNRAGSSAGQTFTYNALDQTTSITHPGGGSAIPMTYAGARQDRRVTAGTTTFVSDGLGLGSQTTEGSRTSFTRGPDGVLLELDQLTGLDNYYLLDGDGFVVATTDPDGALVDVYDFDFFGEEIYELEPIDNPWEYLSAYEDEGIELVITDAGYLDLSVDTFTQAINFKLGDQERFGAGGAVGLGGKGGKPASPVGGTAKPPGLKGAPTPRLSLRPLQRAGPKTIHYAKKNWKTDLHDWFNRSVDMDIIRRGELTHGNNGYVQYNLPGHLGSRSGMFEIGGRWLTKKALLITHRFFST